MRIHFENTQQRTNVTTVTTSQENPQTKKTASLGAYAIDISGKVMDNSAYSGHGQTTEDVMQKMQATDVDLQQDYATVMSNSMSYEDYQKMTEEGYKPGSIDVETVVTVVDQIKAKLAQAGVEIEGYNDSLSAEDLSRITGNIGLGNDIARSLRENDLPVTEENVRACQQAYEKAEELQGLEEGAVKYMIENEMEPTIDNLYRAKYVGATDAGRQAQGYYADDVSGYYAKKADFTEEELESLRPQIEKVLKEAGLEGSQKAYEEAEWLLQEGIPFTADNLQRLETLTEISYPLDYQKVLKGMVTAIANGQSPSMGLVTEGESYLKKAASIQKAVESLTEEAVKEVIEEGKPLTIHNLIEKQEANQKESSEKASYKKTADSEIENGGKESHDSAYHNAIGQIIEEDLDGSASGVDLIKATRQLMEIRLQMTIEANLKLLKSNYHIDTMELEELVEKLKEVEAQKNQVLFQADTAQEAEKKASLYEEVLWMRGQIPHLPAAAIGQCLNTDESTLQDVYDAGKTLQEDYQKAGQAYETMMTAPRGDLGDSIKKAFQNVDAILEDMGLEPTEGNRKAVRILGYNTMEVTRENIEAIKSAAHTVERVVEKLTPGNALQLIRNQINPLTLSMEELENTLDAYEGDEASSSENYARFLYHLEQNKEITEEERTSYIGIYRLLRQVEKSDGAVIGSLVNQNMDISLKNLLSGIRTRAGRGMEVKVDDSFGAISDIIPGGESISSQITEAFKGKEEMSPYYQKLVKDTLEKIQPEILRAIDADADMSLERFADAVKSASEGETQEAAREYIREEAQMLRSAYTVSENVVEELLEGRQPVTADNLLAAQAMKQQRGKLFSDLLQSADKKGREAVREAMGRIQDALTDKESAKKAYQEFEETAVKALDAAVEESTSYVDVKAMSSMFKQLSLTANLVQEESYQVPVEINGEITAIHLRILHGKEQEGKAVVTMETEATGKVAAVFSIEGERGSGYISFDKPEAEDGLQGAANTMKEQLEKEGIILKELPVIYTKGLDLEASQKRSPALQKTPVTKKLQEKDDSQSNEKNGKVSTNQLYGIAKYFIKTIQSMKA